MNDDALHRDLVRGAKAQAALENDLLKEAFATLEADYLSAWRTSAARDTEMREALWRAVNQLGKVKEHLAHVAAGGKMAQRQIDELHRMEAARKR
jgi:hypothetical protein